MLRVLFVPVALALVAPVSAVKQYWCQVVCSDFEYVEFYCNRDCADKEETFEALENCLMDCEVKTSTCKDVCHENYDRISLICAKRCGTDDECLHKCAASEFKPIKPPLPTSIAPPIGDLV
ncbi:cysteine-rich neurotrophic factor [Aplysia californica]|uniref:Cysteine-rich neurotrophic factor n=1 Tax=Aplysia californica TaxID=6500 RepID=A0ABM0JP73_APLCA|nr:cysteine-rich neurotrophic factor [Aplysia californica]